MFDFVIIGGGIIGLLTAKELHKNGATVAIIEKGSLGQQATWAAGGILSPMRPWHYSNPVNAISDLSQAVYQELSNELHQETGIDPEWVLSGMLVLNDNDMPQALTWCQQYNAIHQVVSTAYLSAHFSHLRPIDEPALLRNNVATIRTNKLLAALTQYLKNKGVTFHNQQAEGLIIKGDSVIEVQTTSGKIRGKEYIICSGAWSPELIPDMYQKPRITPVKGQMISFPPVEIPDLCMVMDGDSYIIPRKDGRIVVGSTREHTGFDASKTQQAFSDLKNFAQQLFPTLNAIEPDAHWAGLRPSSPNSIPYICRVDPVSNLSLNAGHYRNGIVTAPASATLLVDLLLGHELSIDPSPYQLHR